MKKINVEDLWMKEWDNAYKFFHSQGNIKTRSRLKAKWYKEFKKMMFNLADTMHQNMMESLMEGDKEGEE